MTVQAPTHSNCWWTVRIMMKQSWGWQPISWQVDCPEEVDTLCKVSHCLLLVCMIVRGMIIISTMIQYMHECFDEDLTGSWRKVYACEILDSERVRIAYVSLAWQTISEEVDVW